MEENSLDSFHRKELRSTLQMSWKDKVSNEELNNRANSSQTLTVKIFADVGRPFSA